MENITDDDFQKKISDGSSVVLIDFWAEWCTPCKMLAPVLEEIEKEYKGKVKVLKMNVENASKSVRSNRAERLISTNNKSQVSRYLEEHYGFSLINFANVIADVLAERTIFSQSRYCKSVYNKLQREMDALNDVNTDFRGALSVI